MQEEQHKQKQFTLEMERAEARLKETIKSVQAYYRILGIDNGEVSTGSTDGNDRGDQRERRTT